jgi:hypothetical protein
MFITPTTYSKSAIILMAFETVSEVANAEAIDVAAEVTIDVVAAEFVADAAEIGVVGSVIGSTVALSYVGLILFH